MLEKNDKKLHKEYFSHKKFKVSKIIIFSLLTFVHITTFFVKVVFILNVHQKQFNNKVQVEFANRGSRT